MRWVLMGAVKYGCLGMIKPQSNDLAARRKALVRSHGGEWEWRVSGCLEDPLGSLESAPQFAPLVKH